MGRSSPIARVATEAGVIGANVAEGRVRGCTARAREYLLEVLPQFPELLGEFVQCRLGRRAAFNARAVISSHLGLRFWPNSEPSPSLCRSSERPEQMYATGDTHARGRLSGKGNGPQKGYTGRSPQEAACQTTTVPLAAAAAGTAARAHQVRTPGVDPCPVRPECSSRSRARLELLIELDRRQGAGPHSSVAGRSRLHARPCGWGSHGQTLLQSPPRCRGRVVLRAPARAAPGEELTS